MIACYRLYQICTLLAELTTPLPHQCCLIMLVVSCMGTFETKERKGTKVEPHTPWQRTLKAHVFHTILQCAALCKVVLTPTSEEVQESLMDGALEPAGVHLKAGPYINIATVLQLLMS